MTPLETPAADDLRQGDPSAPSEQWFERLAEHEPLRLFQLIAQRVLEPQHLTFAAEIAGRVPNAALVVEFLVPLLDHAHSVVREGAVYGLAPHLAQSMRAREALLFVQDNDPSPGVRTAAREALTTR
ncbi:MAG: hypothetical protein ACO1OB_22680 [Archangium sp.]